MCVQVAYVGRGSAAPILLKMLKRIEGLWGWFLYGNGNYLQWKIIPR